jgi:glycerophosphoryl diester phosphodiesterase
MIDLIKWILVGILIVSALYILSVRGRAGHSGLVQLRGWNYAHRGLHNEERPENSMTAFRAALDHGYGIELDIHLMKDGNLAVIHDSSLKRTAGADVKIEELTAGDLSSYRLNGTEEQIPLFRDVLALYDGKAPMIVELKATGNNHAALCRKACELLADYHGVFCLESCDPRCILWLRQNRPEIIRGQLTEDYFQSNSDLPWILKFLLKFQIENFLTMPDFVAYRCSDRHHFSNFIVRKIWGVQGVTWTIKTQKELDAAVTDGWIPIFESFEP